MSLPSRLRPLALAAALALGVGMTGCANYETLEPYQPAAGVVTDAPGMKVRNLMLLDQGGKYILQGTLLADEADSLTSVSGTSVKPDGSNGKPLTVTSSKVTLPRNSGVNLAASKIAASGNLTPGGVAKLTLNFAKAAPVTMTVPVVDAAAIDISTASPSAK